MATLGSTAPTLADLAKRMDPNGTIATVIELLAKTNQILDDIPWVEGNLPTGHRTTLRTSLPTPTWRLFNAGVAPTKSTTSQIDFSCGMLQAYSEVDMDLLKLYGNQAAGFRASEDNAHLEAMSQSFADTLFYGSAATNPERWNGFATIYGDVNYGEATATAKDGAVIDAGGSSTDNTSIWLVFWGENTVHGIYPKGMEAGLQSEDLGRDTKTLSDGSMYEVMRSRFIWNCGMAYRDWRSVVRIANIDVSSLLSQESGYADLTPLMIRAYWRVPAYVRNMGRPVFYVNKLVGAQLHIQALGKASGNLTVENFDGKPITTFLGVPIRECDSILATEARLT